MPNIEVNNFSLGGIEVAHFRTGDGYAVCVEKDNTRVCGKFTLSDLDADASKLAKLLKSYNIDISIDTAKEILTKVKEHYGINEATSVAPGIGNELDAYLPRSESVNVPNWTRGLELRSTEYCLNTLSCKKSLVIYTREDSQYALVAIKKMVTVKAEGEELPDYTPIALLPRFMGQVYDPYYREWYFIAVFDGRVIATASDFNEFINTLTNTAGYKFFVAENKQLLGIIRSLIPEAKIVISPGVTDDGFIDPYGVLDITDYGVEPFLKAYEWIRKYYPETNARWAWFNVMATFAKVITPMVRYHNKTFNDMVVYNYGQGGEGKTSLVRYVVVPLLDGENENAKKYYYIVIDGAVRTEAQLRNLLALNRLPLILDEQDRKSLSANVGVFLSAVVGIGTIRVQAAKYGQGIAVRFLNLRGMVAFTNVPFVKFLREVMNEASDYAIIRRFIEINWDAEPINLAAFKDLPELKPIYGFATRLWQKYKDELIKSADLLELIEKLAIAMGREYLGDAKVSEMVQFTLDIVKELREAKKNERLALTDADASVSRAYEFVGNELKTPQLTAVKVLRYLLENPQRAGIKLTRPRSREELERQKADLDIAIHKYLMYRYGIEDTQDRGVVGKDPDAVALYVLLKDAYDNDKVTVVLFARSPLMPGTPKVFLGAPESSFTINGVKKNGYAIPLAKLVRIFLERELEDENEGPTGEPSSDGEAP